MQSHRADGVLVCKGKPRGYLYTNPHWTNCVVRFQWRYPSGTTNGNGGVLVRVTEPHAVWPKCLEFQLNLKQAGDFWAIRDYLVTGPAERIKVITNSVHGTLRHLPKDQTVEKPPGEWNWFEGRVEGGIATQMINGQMVNQATGCEIVGGRVAFTSEGQEIHFRDIEVRER